MKYLEEVSIIFDTISFIMIHENKDRYIRTIYESPEDIERTFVHYNTVDFIFTKYQFDEVLLPFFYYDGSVESFVAKYFNYKYIKGLNSINDLYSDKEDIYKSLVEHYFKNNEINLKNVQETNKILQELKVPENLKIDLLCVLYNFNDVFELYISLLNKVYIYMKNYYIQQKPINKFMIDDTLKKQLTNKYELSIKKMEESSYFISLMKPEVFTTFKLEQMSFLFGINIFKDGINKILGYNHISIDSICKIFSNYYSQKIIELLGENGEMNAADIARALYTTQTGISRHIKYMLEQRALVVSRKSNLSTFYKLNYDYFIEGKKVIDRYYDNMFIIKENMRGDNSEHK